MKKKDKMTKQDRANLRALRRAKAEEGKAPRYSLAQVRRMLGLTK